MHYKLNELLLLLLSLREQYNYTTGLTHPAVLFFQYLQHPTKKAPLLYSFGDNAV